MRVAETAPLLRIHDATVRKGGRAKVIPEVERVVLLKHGSLYRDGYKHEVLRPEILSAVFGAALHVESTNAGYYRMHIAPT